MHTTKTSSLVNPYTFVVHLIRTWLYHPYWSVKTPCPIFAPSAIFSQTPPKPSQDQSKSILDLTSQDRNFRALLKLD
ncbi:hypothetical protein F2Q68_00025515 [Brassica cretica]|uniref:Uncharacterized protein n=1 Tax=Brassica cretica TaxID=69181 RepID=A0A8S9IJY7_BRACR|nr:hypothetical protein F2Q68_00025515 [Brassica cretica]